MCISCETDNTQLTVCRLSPIGRVFPVDCVLPATHTHTHTHTMHYWMQKHENRYIKYKYYIVCTPRICYLHRFLFMAVFLCECITMQCWIISINMKCRGLDLLFFVPATSVWESGHGRIIQTIQYRQCFCLRSLTLRVQSLQQLFFFSFHDDLLGGEQHEDNHQCPYSSHDYTLVPRRDTRGEIYIYI